MTTAPTTLIRVAVSIDPDEDMTDLVALIAPVTSWYEVSGTDGVITIEVKTTSLIPVVDRIRDYLADLQTM